MGREWYSGTQSVAGARALLAVGAVGAAGEEGAGALTLLRRGVDGPQDRAEPVEAIGAVLVRHRLAELSPPRIGRVVVEDVARRPEETLVLAVRPRVAADAEDAVGLLARGARRVAPHRLEAGGDVGRVALTTPVGDLLPVAADLREHVRRDEQVAVELVLV